MYGNGPPVRDRGAVSCVTERDVAVYLLRFTPEVSTGLTVERVGHPSGVPYPCGKPSQA